MAVGGNATPPTVPGVKGYSFAGWDKSYVNINPGTRSMAVDITAQYQLTSGIQNPGSLTDLANALMALGVPVAVKNGFITLGAAIKGLWEDIKTVFRNFAGQDSAGEILDNIEAGVDEAGKGDSEDIVIGLGDIAGKYGYDDIDEPTYGKC